MAFTPSFTGHLVIHYYSFANQINPHKSPHLSFVNIILSHSKSPPLIVPPSNPPMENRSLLLPSVLFLLLSLLWAVNLGQDVYGGAGGPNPAAPPAPSPPPPLPAPAPALPPPSPAPAYPAPPPPAPAPTYPAPPPPPAAPAPAPPMAAGYGECGGGGVSGGGYDAGAGGAGGGGAAGGGGGVGGGAGCEAGQQAGAAGPGFPLPTCYFNKDGFMCCNKELENLMDNTYRNISKSRGGKWKKCNIHQVAVATQRNAEKHFGVDFETVVGAGDFASKNYFNQDLICKIKRENSIILAFASPN